MPPDFFGRERRRSRPLLVLLLVVATLAGACVGGPETSAEEWVADVCTDATTWVRNITGLEGQFQTDVQAAGEDIDQLKSVLVAFFEEAVAATSDLIEGVVEAGVPDVETGDAITEAVRVGLTQARDVLADAQADIEAASTDDPDTFGQTLTEATSSIEQGFQRIGETLDTATSSGPGGAELEEAAEDQPSCQELEELSSGA
jgi:hypothetical protein